MYLCSLPVLYIAPLLKVARSRMYIYTRSSARARHLTFTPPTARRFPVVVLSARRPRRVVRGVRRAFLCLSRVGEGWGRGRVIWVVCVLVWGIGLRRLGSGCGRRLVTGSCVIRETTQTGCARSRPRVYLSTLVTTSADSARCTTTGTQRFTPGRAEEPPHGQPGPSRWGQASDGCGAERRRGQGAIVSGRVVRSGGRGQQVDDHV